MSKGRLWLSVPYEEKDHAKQLGARWNPTVRRWWISPADLQRVEASNDSWLMGGGYTIYVTGKLYLNVVDCPCPACREDVKVASLLATGAFEIVEIDDEDSEPCSPMSPAASTEGADADPVYLSHVGVVSDQALRAKIDSLCPTFWPNRYGVYRNHCEACGYEFHENHDLFGGQCPFTPTADPMCLSPENGAVNLGIDTPIQVDAGLRWTGEYRAAACSKMQEEWPPRSDQLTGLAIESVQIADGASDQSSLDSLPATPRAGFWSKLVVLIITPANKYNTYCHSGERRNPGVHWMPDQVRHDGSVPLNCRVNMMSELEEAICFYSAQGIRFFCKPIPLVQ
jgi:hypothetical protein